MQRSVEAEPKVFWFGYNKDVRLPHRRIGLRRGLGLHHGLGLHRGGGLSLIVVLVVIAIVVAVVLYARRRR
jgi:hypothetical protein